MKKKPLVLSVLVAAVGGAAILSVARVRAQSPGGAVITGPPLTVQIHDGALQGSIMDGIATFKGIPFAAPPVGANRWRAPQPVTPWQGIKEVNSFGPAPMQNKVIAMAFSKSLSVKLSEDCLYLNVWAPQGQKKLPVMVWIYGGGFNVGLTSSPLYDGARLAKRGVVVVSIAYRLGPFGFLAHPELSAESGKGSGNYGLMDQMAGLRWVKQNIAQFGGDPANVTIFGESAGGESTSMLAASPQAKGLFSKVICESGSSFAPMSGKGDFVGFSALPDAEKQGADFLAKLKTPNIAAARQLSSDAIEAGTANMGLFPFFPTVDGYVIRDDQYRQYLAGDFNDTPILVGTNSDDGGMFSPQGQTPDKFETFIRDGFGPQADQVLAAYPHATNEETALSTRQIVGDTIFAWGTWSWARLQAQHGKGAAYLYYFDRHPANAPNGASHGAEIPYVFGSKSDLSTPDDQALSDTMQLYWTNFAKTGNPNGPGLVTWPAFREPDAKALRIGSTLSALPVPNLPKLKALDAYFARLRVNEPAPPQFKR